MGWFGSFNTALPRDKPRSEPPLTRAVAGDSSVPDVPLKMLEDFATPGEFMAERDAAIAAGHMQRRALLDGSLAGKDLAKFAEPQPFSRHQVATGATLYRGPGGRKRLLICFGGRGGWIGPPTPVFLQCIDAARWDVLILRDVHLCHFRLGVAGIGTNFAAVIRWLGTKAARYNHVTCLGYSAGGLPAVWTGLALGADRVICISGQRPQDVNRLFTKATLPGAYDAACACVDASITRPFGFIHAAGHAADKSFADGMAEQMGGLAIGAVGYNMHSLLGYMWMRGHLQGILDIALTAPLNAALQGRFTRHLRTPASPYLTARADQIPAVAKGVAPDGN
jgi:hypothetical protein